MRFITCMGILKGVIMKLKEFISKYVDPELLNECLVEICDDTVPFPDIRNAQALVFLNIPEKSWLNHEVLKVYPMLFKEHNEHMETQRARIRILISKMEKKYGD